MERKVWPISWTGVYESNIIEGRYEKPASGKDYETSKGLKN